MAAAAPEPVTVQVPDGMHLTVLTVPSAEAVAVQAWLLVGSASDPVAVPGLAHLLEHIVVGSGDGALEQVLAPLGGQLNAFTGGDYTRYTALLPPEGLPLWLSALGSRLDHPVIGEGVFAQERAVVQEELRGRRLGLSGRVEQQVDAALWPDHPYGRIALSQEADLAEATPALAAAHMAGHYLPSRRHLIVVGPVTLETVLAALVEEGAAAEMQAVGAPLPGALPPPPAGVAGAGGPTMYRVGGMAWRLPPADHPDHWALRVGLELLEAGGGARWRAALPPQTEAVQVGVDVSWYRQGGRVLVTAMYLGNRSPDRIRAELAAAAEALSETVWLEAASAQAAQRALSRRLWGASWDLEESARWLGWSASVQGVPQGPAQLGQAVDALSLEQIQAAWRRWIAGVAPVPVLLDVG